MEEKRKVIDCRWFPSDTNCSLCIMGTEEEVLKAATEHAISCHGYSDTTEVRKEMQEELRQIMKDEEA
ncbi:MAG: DUF1059 domain-containing protein [Alphaproteobacteria bacterium]|nr:DUF1059 domain-containing protein [Alphaproteobacteria bacterium]